MTGKWNKRDRSPTWPLATQDFLKGQVGDLPHVRWWLLAGLLITVPAAFAQDVPMVSPKVIARDIVGDQKQIWTSPFRIKRQNAKWWVIFGAATGALIATDRLTTQQLPKTGHPVAFSRDVSQLGAVYTLVPLTGGLYLTGALTGGSKLRDTGLLGGEALVDSLIVSEVFKVATGRQRPMEGDGGVHFFHGSDAFPSGHTIGSFAFASVIAHRYHDNRAVVVLAYGLATMVGAARFGARQHSASDIVAGGVMGWFIGKQVTDRRRVGGRSPAKEWLLPQVVPQVQPADHSYGLLLAWHP
jgi:membrane-associated phospholipid phosphatase